MSAGTGGPLRRPSSIRSRNSRPRAAALRPELGEGIRVVTFGRYLICYAERDGDQVVIERLVHGAWDFKRLFGS